MLDKNGVPTQDNIEKRIPPESRRKMGAVAMIECFQNIPCNPCSTACKRGAIQEFSDINDLPKIDYDICNGCGLCISRCPGLAIFVIDETYSDAETSISLPYEFLPLPEARDQVDLLNRNGEKVGTGTVLKVRNGKYEDKTPVVIVAVPKRFSMVVRNIRVEGEI